MDDLSPSVSPGSDSVPGNGGPILEAADVVRRYGEVTALGGVSVAVAAGECLALVGESGSGKTTLLRCFNRMVEPDAGEVRVEGRPAGARPATELRRRIGYAQQDGGLLPHWRVLRNVGLVPWLQGRPAPEGRRLAEEALDLVGLPASEFGDRWPRDLSGGQRQRVALARALAARPSIVLLDEPFGALDAITRAELQEAFLALRRRLGFTTVLVTHDMHEAMLLADRIAVLRAGRIEQVTAPDAMAEAPGTPYVAELLRKARVRPS